MSATLTAYRLPTPTPEVYPCTSCGEPSVVVEARPFNRHGMDASVGFYGSCAEHTTRPIGPCRIQLRRVKGWRKPPGAVVVARPSRWGNPWTVGAIYETGRGTCRVTAQQAVNLYRRWLTDEWVQAPKSGVDRRVILDSLPELRGKDLACWCPLDQPCHADVLLEVANA